ncbi:proclotting enzyme-like [Anopheles aquasalis]|uniref:proclotting enzyme-like n=1 Tax=Anopheles aquasalis TaxID=42839 RepID=UPI00215B2FE1|nr:proclotting enzyme-like [Anopheles aquasalis]
MAQTVLKVTVRLLLIGLAVAPLVYGLSAYLGENEAAEGATVDEVLQLIGDRTSNGPAGNAAPHKKTFAQRKQEREQKHLDLNVLLRKRRAPQGSPSIDAKAAQPRKECRTRAGEKGYCTRYQNCKGPELRDNVWSILQHLCLIDGLTVGICCPDVVQEGNGPEFSLRLPATADSYDDVDGLDGNDAPTARDSMVRPEERGCGISTKQLSKISGGQQADANEWPWMVALVMSRASFCGGSLITDRHVLTAAHCVLNLKLTQFVVRLGEYDFKQYNETRYRDFRVSEMRIHADFDQSTYENDVALLKLIQPSFFNSYIWPICMPPLDDNWTGYQGVVVGWGTQFFGGPYSPILMEVKVPIWANRECQEVYINRIFDTSLCAGEYEGGKDACQGDSGGPLMIQLPNRRWAVVGVVSSGIRCGEANHPGIYTRVSSFVRWIVENATF